MGEGKKRANKQARGRDSRKPGDGLETSDERRARAKLREWGITTRAGRAKRASERARKRESAQVSANERQEEERREKRSEAAAAADESQKGAAMRKMKPRASNR